jgi:hypothetical protein
MNEQMRVLECRLPKVWGTDLLRTGPSETQQVFGSLISLLLNPTQSVLSWDLKHLKWNIKWLDSQGCVLIIVGEDFGLGNGPTFH